MGFRGPIHSWLASFLTDRYQYVEVGGSVSCSLPISIGVPQGSTLGPLLFILYINDMMNSLINMKIIHFADDSTLHAMFPKNTNISAMVNDELSSINKWLNVNKLCLNVDKTKYMLFSIKDKPPDMNLCIGSTLIGRTNVHKFLGVHIDDKITFSDHITKLCSKISRGIGMLRRLKYSVPNDVIKQLYFAFIHSHYTYAINSYQSAYQNQTHKLKNLINKALKLILNTSSSSDLHLKENSIMNFDMSVEYFCCINMFKILKTNAHPFFMNRITSFQIEHEHGTRAASLEHVNLPFY